MENSLTKIMENETQVMEYIAKTLKVVEKGILEIIKKESNVATNTE